jgi:hypothetical protein
MLTTQEMTDARAKLNAARTLIDAVHAVFVGAGYIAGTHDLEYAAELIADEISQLDKAISGVKP